MDLVCKFIELELYPTGCRVVLTVSVIALNPFCPIGCITCDSFGDIYLGIGQNGEQVAVKFEKHSTRCPQLRHEYKVYRELQNCAGFARVRSMSFVPGP